MTLSPDDLAAMGRDHVACESDKCDEHDGCSECEQCWPCDSRRLLDEVEALRGALEPLYWFFCMVENGGPDGSDLDYAVYDEARAAAASRTTEFAPNPEEES